MLSINTNLSSLIAQSSMKTSTNKLNQAIERMTTGFKINHASDNAANYSISTNMTTKINSYMVAEDNALQGLDLISTAEGALSQIQDKLERLRALAEQSANGTYGGQSLKALKAEVNALVDEIQRTYANTEYNGINILGESSKFIDSIERRDTSGLTRLSEVDASQKLAKGTYAIATADELVKLATMQNSNKITADSEFVLAADIDLSEVDNFVPIGKTSFYEFCGIFDGNGYTISNLKISESVDDSYKAYGLFGWASAEIKNVAIEDASIVGIPQSAGILVGNLGASKNSNITNCYSTGHVEGTYTVGGLVGQVRMGNISKCYSSADVVLSDDTYSWSTAGGLLGMLYASNIQKSIDQCFANGSVTTVSHNGTPIIGGLVGTSKTASLIITNSYADCYMQGENIDLVAGFIGVIRDGNSVEITNCYSSSKLNKTTSTCCAFGGAIIDTAGTFNNCYIIGDNDNIDWLLGTLYNSPNTIFNNCFYSSNYEGISLGTNVQAANLNNLQLCDNEKPFDYENGSVIATNKELSLQIGISGNNNSQLTFKPSFVISDLNSLRNLTNNPTEVLAIIDSMIANISSKSTEYGATQNRLESVLDEISIQYDNLVSSRSTIRDANIAEVSATYIQQQILQQASATLLATANQSPSIVLQLI